MASSLQNVLPEPISEKLEAAILEKMQAKMRGACGLVARVVRILEEHFGKEEVHRVVREKMHQVRPREADKLGTPEADLAAYVDRLEKGCAGSHEWRRVSTTDTAIAYEFTSCMWAKAFRDLDAADIGSWICEGDDPGVRSYHPKLRCTLTKTLMAGDDCCNHVFHVAEEETE